MLYREREFKEFYKRNIGDSTNSMNSYNSALGRIDRALHGLDEAIAARGVEELRRWSQTTSEPPFHNYPANARAALNSYFQFHLSSQNLNADQADPIIQDETITDTRTEFFRVERDLQKAVRSQLDRIEEGLVEADGGTEYILTVGGTTGRVDVLAKDRDGCDVIIELKAGSCPQGALEQALGYAQALSDELGVDRVRIMIVARDFSDRIRAAAQRINDLELKRYSDSLQFEEVK